MKMFEIFMISGKIASHFKRKIKQCQKFIKNHTNALIRFFLPFLILFFGSSGFLVGKNKRYEGTSYCM